MTIKFKKWVCFISKGTYKNGRTVLQLIDVTDHSPIAVATVNLPDVSLEPDEVIIKNYSENEGMSEALQIAGVIGEPLRSIRTGYVFVMVHKLLI